MLKVYDIKGLLIDSKFGASYPVIRPVDFRQKEMKHYDHLESNT